MSKLQINRGRVKYYKHLTRLSSLVLFIFAYAIVITGSTYAFMSLSAISDGIANGQGGCFEVSYSGQELNAGNILSTDNYLNGAHTTVTLSKASSCKIYTEANIYIHTNTETTAPIDTTEAMRYKLIANDSYERNGFITTKDDTLLGSVPLTDTSNTYTIYVWIDSDLSGGVYHDTTYSGYIYAESGQTSTIDIDTEPPVLFLKKETYIEDDFSEWELENAYVDSEGSLVLGEDGNTANSYSKLYKVNGNFWYPTFDAYSNNTTTRGVNWGSGYFDDNMNPVLSLEGYSSNGWAIGFSPINTWVNNILWQNNYNSKTSWSAIAYPRYGPNVKYVRLNFATAPNNSWSKPMVKIRNLKIYGEMIPNNFYDIYINSFDNIGIVETKYAFGEYDVSYFTSNGIAVTNNKVTVTSNGTYTFYVSDAAGNSSITTIDINNII